MALNFPTVPQIAQPHSTTVEGLRQDINFMLRDLQQYLSELGLNLSTVDGDITASVDTSMPIGSIVAYGGTVVPNANWLFLYGQNVSRTTYATLFARYGTTFGVGDGSTTFGLPDLRGRVIAGQDDMGGTSANRLTTPINGDTLGATGGSESHTLTDAEISAHTHDVNPGSVTSSGRSIGHTHSISITTGNASTGHDHDFSGDTATNTTGGGALDRVTALRNDTAGTQDRVTSTQGSVHTHLTSGTSGGESVDHTHNVDVANTTSTSVGSDTAHNNVQPTIILNYIIRAL